MNRQDIDRALQSVLTPKRDVARAALESVCGLGPITAIQPVTGGMSGAAIFRVDTGAKRYLLRVEGPDHPMLRRNPHRFTAERAASEAGIAPAVHLVDEVSGVVIADFIERRALASFPGGRIGLARALGELLARLQAVQPFPALIDYAELIEGMLKHMQGRFAPGALDPHFERLAAVRAVMAADGRRVASHNDPNPRNILYDGERLWLIDWESAYGNRPGFDAAILLDNLAAEPDLEAAFVQGWLGEAMDEEARAQLAASRALTRLYYACFTLSAFPPEPGATQETVGHFSAADFVNAIAARTLQPLSPGSARAIGTLLLDAALRDERLPLLGQAMASAMFGPGVGLDGL